MTTKSRESPDFDWNDYRAIVDEWLLSRESTAKIKENDENQRFARATIVLFGWLPLAIVMFWLSLILTRGIAFVNDDPIPRYGLMAFGHPNKAVLVSLEGEPDHMSLQILVPLGTHFVTLQLVPKGLACAWNDGQKIGATDGIRETDILNEHQKTIAHQIDVTVPASPDVFGLNVEYGSYSQVLTLGCDVQWEPKQESFSKYDVTIKNALTYDPDNVIINQYGAHGDKPENLVLSAYKLNESKILTLAGRRTLQDDERNLIPGSYAEIEWNSETGTETRDALFVVIGAFIAIGAAILIEGLRPHVELAIESNYANAPGKVD